MRPGGHQFALGAPLICGKGASTLHQRKQKKADLSGADAALRLEEQFCFSLYAVSRAVTDLYRPLLAKLNLTYPQYLVMLVLWEHRTLTVTGVSNRLHLDGATVTPLLKRLEAKGLVRRERDNADERQVNVALTAAGQRLKKLAETIPDDFQCLIPLPPGKAERLRDEMTALLARFAKRNADIS